MLFTLWNLTFCIVECAWKTFLQKSIEEFLRILENAQTGKLPKNHNSCSRSKKILGIAIKRFSKTFSVPKDTLDAQFDIISNSSRQPSACVAVTIIMQKVYVLKHFCD